MITCFIAVLILWKLESHSYLLLWAGCFNLLGLFRWIQYRSLNVSTASTQRIFKQGRRYTFSLFLSGVSWGALPLFFFQSQLLEHYIMLLVLLSSAVTALSGKAITNLVFTLPAGIPLIGMIVMEENDFHLWTAAGVILYLVASFLFNRNTHRVIHKSLELKYQNIDLVESLKKQTTAATKANVDKSHFIAAASHDLRQPLHAVNLFVETLDNKITTDEQKNDLNHIKSGLDSLGELFNALLDLAQLDSKSLPINKVNLSLDTHMSKWIGHYSIQATNKNLDFVIKDCDHVVHTDPILLEQVIRNLLSNAIRYTNEGQVEMYCTLDNDDILLHIDDTGVGISGAEQENMFNEFYQVNNSERDRNKGLGLGLAIVKRISTLLDYKLNVTSQVGCGTKFTITLPKGLLKAQFDSENVQPLLENKLKHLKVMFIDNETQIIHAMEAILNGWGCEPTCVESSSKALALIEAGYKPDIILSDYRMPGSINGCELANKIQQHVGKLPVIIITGDTDSKVIAEIKAANQIRLTKPLKPAQLRIAISHLTRN